jgi:hypothetical protein
MKDKDELRDKDVSKNKGKHIDKEMDKVKDKGRDDDKGRDEGVNDRDKKTRKHKTRPDKIHDNHWSIKMIKGMLLHNKPILTVKI